ncbi:MAG: PEP-CTERM sorting domain-containing protein [Dehalococcoidia bacterium]|nr:PEP-CTERM sorting domain-containing protein [Dehalococcoidia bacterium]
MKTMKKEMSIFTALFICAVLTFSAAGVRAEAVSMSEAWIDWETLSITGDITWSTQNSQSHAYVEDATDWDEDYQTESGWVDTSAFASIGVPLYHVYGSAYTSNFYIDEEVYALANETTAMWTHADASAERWGIFTANSSGLVTFSADYGLWQDLLTDYVGEWASGYAEAGLWLVNFDTSGENYARPALENEVWDGDSITDSDDGTLTVAVWFDAGNSGQFHAWAYNDADVEVPEPATICLLGLGALSLLRRKR